MKTLYSIMMVVLLSGCAVTWQETKPDLYKDSNRHFNALLPLGWMYLNESAYLGLTKDGEELQKIMVESMRFNQKLAFTKKTFQKEMMPEELAEIDIDNMQGDTGLQKINIVAKEAVNLAGQNAYRITIDYQTKEGLVKKAIIYGFIYRDKLYRIVYDAAKQHYFDATLSGFEEFLKDFTLS